jgi:very-short-patch-repair endonuclease
MIRLRFCNLDEKLLELTRAKLAALAATARRVPYGNDYGPVGTYTDRALIQHETKKQKRHIALRQLIKRSANALQALKPCFMMSPLSVAQYLEPGAISFDVVIMDEASQLRPEDALGVIARAAQLVVVGDQKQLPPTTFFATLGEDESTDEEEDVAAGVKDAESILEVASRTYAPSRMLRWHYRSRHGSLIRFSNQQFYKNRLVVFPAPQPAGRELGVSFVHVPNGIWDGETNHAEAELVANAVLQHMETRQDRSLGVATMNITQRDLIQAEVELRVKQSPLAQAYLQQWDEEIENFFVKNLENVQGDERDVIFVSVTYGPKAPGQPPHQHWGPLTGPSGARRLNVLFTRAKYQVVVFSSITADQVVVSEKSSEGVRVLREYLDYANSGRISDLSFTDRPPESDFEIAVGRALVTAGYEVVPQLGVAGYYLDLAVRDPDHPGAFLAGIECDGRPYHTSKSARDRDRLRQMILEDLGWHIHRIWSTEWLKHPDRELKRLLQILHDIQKSRGN